MREVNPQCLRMYSISQAAKEMLLSRDTVKSLVSSGKLGYIEIGKSKKIPHIEIIRFQKKQIIRNNVPTDVISNEENLKRKINKSGKIKISIGGDEMLENLIMKEEKWQ